MADPQLLTLVLVECWLSEVPGGWSMRVRQDLQCLVHLLIEGVACLGEEVGRRRPAGSARGVRAVKYPGFQRESRALP